MSAEPRVLRAGDSVAWSRSVDGALASDGWALAYRLVPRDQTSAVDIVATAVGDGWEVDLTADQTAEIAAGEYVLVGAVTKGTERRTVYGLPCTVLPNLMDAAQHDGRSVARQIVDAIDEYFRTQDRAVLERQHGDRRLRFQSQAELIKTRAFYAAQIRREEMVAGLIDGSIESVPGRVQTRFGETR